jgi:hypothetical protein
MGAIRAVATGKNLGRWILAILVYLRNVKIITPALVKAVEQLTPDLD